jgi:hypothetical protein
MKKILRTEQPLSSNFSAAFTEQPRQSAAAAAATPTPPTRSASNTFTAVDTSGGVSDDSGLGGTLNASLAERLELNRNTREGEPEGALMENATEEGGDDSPKQEVVGEAAANNAHFFFETERSREDGGGGGGEAALGCAGGETSDDGGDGNAFEQHDYGSNDLGLEDEWHE